MCVWGLCMQAAMVSGLLLTRERFLSWPILVVYGRLISTPTTFGLFDSPFSSLFRGFCLRRRLFHGRFVDYGASLFISPQAPVMVLGCHSYLFLRFSEAASGIMTCVMVVVAHLCLAHIPVTVRID